MISFPSSEAARFVMSQSRHTDISIAEIPLSLAKGNNRSIGLGEVKKLIVHGMPALDYLKAFCRSEVFDDVLDLIHRLGFRPKYGISRLALKDNGFWSCVWTIRFPPEDIRRLLKLNIIIQEDKVSRALRSSKY